MPPFRRSSLFAIALLFSACKESEAIKAELLAAETKGPLDTAWPAVAVPAFLPRGQGCQPPYAEFRDVCAHAAHSYRTSTAHMEIQLEAYQRGAAPPRVGGPVAQPTPAVRSDARSPRLAPGALAKGAGVSEQDAEQARQRRLRALEQMLAMAKERLASERKKRGASAGSEAETGTPEVGLQGGSHASGASTGEPLTQLVGVLKQMQRGHAANMLEQMEARGMRQELGEDVWGQLNPESRSSTALGL